MNGRKGHFYKNTCSISPHSFNTMVWAGKGLVDSSTPGVAEGLGLLLLVGGGVGRQGVSFLSLDTPVALLSYWTWMGKDGG